jgi:hypothetical protein
MPPRTTIEGDARCQRSACCRERHVVEPTSGLPAQRRPLRRPLPPGRPCNQTANVERRPVDAAPGRRRDQPDPLKTLMIVPSRCRVPATVAGRPPGPSHGQGLPVPSRNSKSIGGGSVKISMRLRRGRIVAAHYDLARGRVDCSARGARPRNVPRVPAGEYVSTSLLGAVRSPPSNHAPLVDRAGLARGARAGSPRRVRLGSKAGSCCRPGSTVRQPPPMIPWRAGAADLPARPRGLQRSYAARRAPGQFPDLAVSTRMTVNPPRT